MYMWIMWIYHVYLVDHNAVLSTIYLDNSTIQFLCTPNHIALLFVLLLAQYGQSYEVEAVPPELQPLLLVALNDPVKRVQLAAAVCQCAIGKPNALARNILQKALQHGK